MQDFVLPTPKIGRDGEPLANIWEVVMIKVIRAYIVCIFCVPGTEVRIKPFYAFTHLTLTATQWADTVLVFVLQMRKLGVRAPKWPSWDLKPGLVSFQKLCSQPLCYSAFTSYCTYVVF